MKLSGKKIAYPFPPCISKGFAFPTLLLYNSYFGMFSPEGTGLPKLTHFSETICTYQLPLSTRIVDMSEIPAKI